MKKIYALLFSMLAVTGVAAQKPVMAAGSTTCYTGSLDVTMMGAPIATGQSATVSMIEDAEGNFTFSLPDFVISVGGSQLECGDIVVEGVTRTDLEGDGVYDIVGSVNDLSLAEGEIHAKVDISGTENAETGAIDLDIEVGWYTGYPDDMESTMPIAVKFTGTRVGDDPAGVEALPVAGDVLINATTGGVTVSGFVGNVEVYTVDGRLAAIVASDGETMVALRSGLYVVRADKAVKKVIVK